MLPPPRRIGKHRQRPAEADRRQPQQQADAEGGEQVDIFVHALLAQAQVEQGDQQGDAGVEFLAQHLRGAVAEDVAEDAAEDAGDDPGHRHHRQRVVQAQGDIAADHREGDQAHGIEHQEQLPQVVHEA